LASARGTVQESYSTAGNIRQAGFTEQHFSGAGN